MRERLSISGLKTWKTMDWPGYQGNLLLDGERIAWFHNDGNGGEMDYTVTKSVEFGELLDWIKTLPLIKSEEFKGLEITEDIETIVDEMVADIELEKKLKRYRKKSLVYRIEGDPKNMFRAINTLDKAVAEKNIRIEFPTQTITYL